MYLTYDEYIRFGGDTIDEIAFENLEFEARTQINYWTFNRLTKETVISEAVKRCTYKLITLLYDQQLAIKASIPTDNGSGMITGIMSQSNDGVSISYNTSATSKIIDMSKDNIKLTIDKYLADVKNSLGQKVLYRGIYPNE